MWDIKTGVKQRQTQSLHKWREYNDHAQKTDEGRAQWQEEKITGGENSSMHGNS